MLVAAELMLRQYFGRKGGEAGVKKAQDNHTATILKFIGGDSAVTEFVRSEIQLHSEHGVSPIWLSEDFTLPLFALAAESLCDLLSPTGSGFIKTHVVADDDAFFGVRLENITTVEGSDDHAFSLFALAGTKSYFESEVGMRNAHDLVTRRLAELTQPNW